MKKNKHIFYDTAGYRVIIEHKTPFTRTEALKYLSKNLRNSKIKRKLAKN